MEKIRKDIQEISTFNQGFFKLEGDTTKYFLEDKEGQWDLLYDYMAKPITIGIIERYSNDNAKCIIL